ASPTIRLSAIRLLRLPATRCGSSSTALARDRSSYLQRDSAIDVAVDLDEMLSKHFAVLGTTGVGKSSAVALILQQVLRARPDLRILLLDVHNEYGVALASAPTS